jgi:hypothetical protein
MKLQYTRYNFIDGKDQYDVIIQVAKRGDNIFNCYKNGDFIGKYHPQGGNASMTTAKRMLDKVIHNKK